MGTQLQKEVATSRLVLGLKMYLYGCPGGCGINPASDPALL